MLDKTANQCDWFVYLIRTKDAALYCGVTTDVDRRFNEHQENGTKTAKYLRGKQPLILAWYKRVGDKRLAMRLEYRIKRLKKTQKERLCCDEKYWLVFLSTTD
ncbi:GIY-YIG nuclease family protein [Veronia pacifica]|uniref:GIY-YIG domain-containing protein n=1 Tax=Veronia pacifica TaxID=1080227 RepID=A0A1C3EMV9_9GAMM|nr:GIY-YIG nuclease family protein [Veronia pacifica]ODA34562.1 hypothetical protein A8L45_06230 [Veronia pacifica]